MKENIITLETGDQLYEFVVLRDVNGDGGEVIVSLRIPERQHQVYIISKYYPGGKLNTHSNLQLGDERKRAIESALDDYAESKKLPTG